MGIGIDTAKHLLAQTTDRAELAACVDVLNEALHAIDTAEPAALKTLAEAQPQAFNAARDAEVSRRLAALVAKHEPKTEPVEPAKGEQPSKAK